MDDPIVLSESEESEGGVFQDFQAIDAELVDYGVSEDEQSFQLSSELSSLNTSDIINKTKCLRIKIIDCYKYPWYYPKYRKQLIKKKYLDSVKHINLVNYGTGTCPSYKWHRPLPLEKKNQVTDNELKEITCKVNTLDETLNNKISMNDALTKADQDKGYFTKNNKIENKVVKKHLDYSSDITSINLDFKKNIGLIGLKIIQADDKIVEKGLTKIRNKKKITKNHKNMSAGDPEKCSSLKCKLKIPSDTILKVVRKSKTKKCNTDANEHTTICDLTQDQDRSQYQINMAENKKDYPLIDLTGSCTLKQSCENSKEELKRKYLTEHSFKCIQNVCTMQNVKTSEINHSEKNHNLNQTRQYPQNIFSFNKSHDSENMRMNFEINQNMNMGFNSNNYSTELGKPEFSLINDNAITNANVKVNQKPYIEVDKIKLDKMQTFGSTKSDRVTGADFARCGENNNDLMETKANTHAVSGYENYTQKLNKEMNPPNYTGNTFTLFNEKLQSDYMRINNDYSNLKKFCYNAPPIQINQSHKTLTPQQMESRRKQPLQKRCIEDIGNIENYEHVTKMTKPVQFSNTDVSNQNSDQFKINVGHIQKDESLKPVPNILNPQQDLYQRQQCISSSEKNNKNNVKIIKLTNKQQNAKESENKLKAEENQIQAISTNRKQRKMKAIQNPSNIALNVPTEDNQQNSHVSLQTPDTCNAKEPLDTDLSEDPVKNNSDILASTTKTVTLPPFSTILQAIKRQKYLRELRSKTNICRLPNQIDLTASNECQEFKSPSIKRNKQVTKSKKNKGRQLPKPYCKSYNNSRNTNDAQKACNVYPSNVYWPHTAALHAPPIPLTSQSMLLPLPPPPPPPPPTLPSSIPSLPPFQYQHFPKNNVDVFRKINIPSPWTNNNIGKIESSRKLENINNYKTHTCSSVSTEQFRRNTPVLSKMIKKCDKAIPVIGPNKFNINRLHSYGNMLHPFEMNHKPLSQDVRFTNMPNYPIQFQPHNQYSSPIFPIPNCQTMSQMPPSSYMESIKLPSNNTRNGCQNFMSPMTNTNTGQSEKDISKISLQNYRKRNANFDTQ